MSFKLCAFSDEADTSLKGQVEALKRNGISLMELRSIDGTNVGTISVEKAKEYAQYLKSQNIGVWSIGSPMGKINIDDNFDEHLKLLNHIIDLAKIFGTDKIRMFSFFVKEHQRHRDEVISRLKKMVEVAEKRGVLLCHENEKGIYGDIAHNVADILDNVPQLKCIFDPANFVQCDQDMDAAIDKLANSIFYIHIKDALKSTYEIVPCGMGDGKIEELLKRVEGDKVLSIEPHLKVFDGYGKIDSHELKNVIEYSNNSEAFDAAASAIKAMLTKLGYSEKNGEWVK